MQEGSWQGDVLVADVEELQGNDASDVFLRMKNKRCSCAERRNHIHIPIF